jgi:hypothetical protein
MTTQRLKAAFALLPRMALGAIVAASLLPAATASAALISEDSSYGANTITLDTATGLQWLDVNLTLNRSITDISSKFGAGQEFAGLRYATQSEIHTLFIDGGLSAEPLHLTADPSDMSALTSLIALLGQTYAVSDQFGTDGLNAPTGPAGPVFFTFAYIRQDTAIPCPCAVEDTGPAPSGLLGGNPDVGSFLVYSQLAAVPELPTWAMLLVGLAGLGFAALGRAQIRRRATSSAVASS